MFGATVELDLLCSGKERWGERNGAAILAHTQKGNLWAK